MAGQNGNNGFGSKNRLNLITSPRDIVAVAFRHRRLMIWSFIGTAVLATLGLLWWNPYQPELDILLHHQRVDPVLTTATPSYGGFSQDAVAPEEQNSEVQMLLSKDLLLKVAEQSGLYKKVFMLPWADPALRIPTAERKLEKSLVITPLTKANVITVTYSSRDPQLAYNVLDSLSKLYIEKNLEVHRPHGAGQFFEQQTDQYASKLKDAEAKLVAFDKTQNVAAPGADRDAALQKVNDLEYSLAGTKATISSTEQRIKALESQLSVIPPRVNTSLHTSDNAALIAQLKGTLATLELRRTDLLARYTPEYLPVREVEDQIAQTRATISAAEKAPLHEDTTDVNPTYQLQASDLAKAKAELPGLQAQASATEQLIRAYRQRILALDRKAVEQADIERDVKTAEQSYLLYLGKRDEERIQNALDAKKILDVSIQAAPVMPQLPYYSRILLGALAILLAIFVSVSSALAAEYLDSSFRTPDEVKMFLDIPVLAAVPTVHN